MRALAALFSGLVIAALLAAAVFFMLPRPQGVPLPQTVWPPLTGTVDRIVVEKAARRMAVYRDGQKLKEYRIALGFAPEGDKLRQGDGKTPEGIFRIDRRNDRSAYTLSLGVNYPRPQDRARARAGGYDPGGDIMIHGQPNAVPEGMMVPGDWTAGCIAVTNTEIRELFAAIATGTEVEIRP